MEINLPVLEDFSLTIANHPGRSGTYPTSHLQKGLILRCQDLDLAEEAVGFGLPVLKRGLQAYFPGDVELQPLQAGNRQGISAIYTIDLVERFARAGRSSVRNRTFYSAKNVLAAFIRKVPVLRSFLTSLSSILRRSFGWETIYEKAGTSSRVRMTYTIDRSTGEVQIEADLGGVSEQGMTEVIVMNELGAHYFTQYEDSSGISLLGNAIGCWDEVHAEQARFVDPVHAVAFNLPRVPGTRLFRGREAVASRLAWSGFGYSIPPHVPEFVTTLRLQKLP